MAVDPDKDLAWVQPLRGKNLIGDTQKHRLPSKPLHNPVSSPPQCTTCIRIGSSHHHVCCICKVNDANTVLVPCGHFHFCKACIINNMPLACPICAHWIVYRQHWDHVTRDLPECLICHTKKRSVIMVPCGHISTCIDCAKQCLQQGYFKCPTCRESIVHAQQLYIGNDCE